MIKTATSHGLSVFFCSVSAAFLVETTKPIWPQFNNLLIKASLWLHSKIGIDLSIEYLNIVIAATVLSALWGLAFKKIQLKN